jgi:hypothetical protein
MLVGKLGWAAFRSEDQARKRSATHMAPRSQATSGGVKGADERVLSAQGSGTRPTTFIGNLQGQPTTRPAKKQAKQTRESKRLPAPAIASRSCVRSCWAIAGAISPARLPVSKDEGSTRLFICAFIDSLTESL